LLPYQLQKLKAMNLHLHESILLLSLDDETGKYTSSMAYVNYAFAAGLVVDLLLEERVKIEDNKLLLTTNAITDSRAMNALIEQLSRRKKPMKVSNWLHTIVQRSSKLYKLCLEKLIQDGILERKQAKILWVFNVNRYPTVNDQPENELRRRIHELLLDDQSTPDPKEQLLLTIISRCQMLSEIMPEKSERKLAEPRLKLLTEDVPMNGHISRAIEEMQVAMMVVTTTSAVT
jgi:hypothetical protein